MNTTTTTPKTINAIDLLRTLANQKPCLNFSDYGDHKIYRQEAREITKDLHDFRELISICYFHIDDLNEKIIEYLRKSSDRLTLTESGKLQYITGQYYPTEYRPACSNVLKSIIWRHFMNKRKADGTSLHETGPEIRKAIKKIVSRRVYNNYFA